MFFTIKIIFWLSLFGVAYSYVLYPLLLLVMGSGRKDHDRADGTELPKVSLIIAAYNEEKVIEKRIQNCLTLDYPRDHLEIIIASDGSDDRTNVKVRSFHAQGVVLCDYKERRGKVNVLNSTVPQAKHDIVIFSDANTVFEKDAMRKLVRPFQDPKVGCVVGQLKFVNALGSKTGELEGVYWRFETFLKKREGQRGALLGANGAIYALRKDLYFICPPETIVEDFVIPMKILEEGYQVVYEPAAVAVEEAAKHIIQEKERRIRIGAGDFQALTMLTSMLNPFKGFPALAFWSHKVLRWFAPFFLITVFVANGLLVPEPLFRLFFILQCLFYVCAFVGQILNWSGIQIKIFSLCYYFVSMNLALLLGFVRFVARTQNVAWERTER